MKYFKKTFAILVALLAIFQSVNAQDNGWKEDKKIKLSFGLNQPLVVDGFNVELDYIYHRFIFEYSHGVSLDFSGNLLPGYLQDQQVVAHMPFSTGFGVGYRFTEWLNLRVEPKWHRFEFYYEGEEQTQANRIAVDANNYSVGLGLYGFFQPFKKKGNFLNGITISPSVRYWPTIASSFENNTFRYENTRTGSTEELKTPASGVGFSPLIINVSIGYSFNLKKQ
jgi:hypothetical protein